MPKCEAPQCSLREPLCRGAVLRVQYAGTLYYWFCEAAIERNSSIAVVLDATTQIEAVARWHMGFRHTSKP